MPCPLLSTELMLVLKGQRGEGVVELCERLLADDLAEFEPKLQRGGSIVLGSRIGADQQQVS
jgi:hypothetical protein